MSQKPSNWLLLSLFLKKKTQSPFSVKGTRKGNILTRNYDHIGPVLSTLHWLPIEQCGLLSGLCELLERSGLLSGLCELLERSGLWSGL